jgi:hypothetical protein
VRKHRDNLPNGMEFDDDEVGVVSQGIPWPYPLALLQELVNIHGGDDVIRRQLFLDAAALLADMGVGSSSNTVSTNNSRTVSTAATVDKALGVLRVWQQCFHPDVIAPTVEGSGAPKFIADAARKYATTHVQRVVWLRDALYSL